MKTALYTIFRCTNYGAVMQAYALARTLRGIMGEDSVDVLNHRMDPRDNHLLGKISNPNTPWFQRWRNRRKFAARYYRPEAFEMRRTKTIRLIDELVRPTTHLFKSPDELRGLQPYATVVVGSDQVWNPVLNHDFGRNQYLGGDLPREQDRVAYAASFGVSELPTTSLDEYRRALSMFRAITVREESGAKICRELFCGSQGSIPFDAQHCGPSVVLDPTMLLAADDWRAAFASAGKDHGATGNGTVQGRHVAAYWVRTVTEADVAALARISKAMSAPVCLMSAGPLPKYSFPPEVVPYVEADPFDFARTVAESIAVVTDSFHGLQFSALFKRPFLALGDLQDPRSNASRLVDFCVRYGIANGVQDIESFRENVTPPFADPAAFDCSALETDRIRSLRTLKELLP